MRVTLYTTHCPKCKVIESKLKSKGVKYIEVSDTDTILKLGFQTVPIIDVDGTILEFAEANNWINNIVGE